MTGLAVALIAVALVGAVLVLSARLTGQVAERFGEDPKPWQLRMLPFGPVLAWLLLSRPGGGGGSWA
jgi:hypothetical protein